ncbi:MAG: Lrp/AsnC family transcriptional regulator [Candidatus Woesearchaeota archaeon]|nr:Lrp/AsnC family transcriptional regulator [Candidatus Woesearchaeota archaeon]
MKLDEKDRKILKGLRGTSRIPFTKIARETGIPIDVVKYRVKKLEREGVIQEYLPYIDHERIDYPMMAYVLFTLYKLDPDTEQKFREHLIAHPKITYVAKYSGKWDYCISACAKNYKELDGIVHDIRTKFSDIIKDYDVMHVIEEYKIYQLADLVAT